MVNRRDEGLNGWIETWTDGLINRRMDGWMGWMKRRLDG